MPPVCGRKRWAVIHVKRGPGVNRGRMRTRLRRKKKKNRSFPPSHHLMKMSIERESWEEEKRGGGGKNEFFNKSSFGRDFVD